MASKTVQSVCLTVFSNMARAEMIRALGVPRIGIYYTREHARAGSCNIH